MIQSESIMLRVISSNQHGKAGGILTENDVMLNFMGFLFCYCYRVNTVPSGRPN